MRKPESNLTCSNPECSKEFYRKVSAHTKSGRNYCSAECRNGSYKDVFIGTFKVFNEYERPIRTVRFTSRSQIKNLVKEYETDGGVTLSIIFD